MMYGKLAIHPPLAPHADTLATPEAVIAGEGPAGPVLVTYCRRNAVGGVYVVAQGIWALWGPLPLDEFVRSLAARSIELSPGEPLERWLDSVTGKGEARH